MGVEDPLQMSDTEGEGDIALGTQQDSYATLHQQVNSQFPRGLLPKPLQKWAQHPVRRLCM